MERPDYRSSRRQREVKVYTVCQESRYLIVRNVPSLGCVDELVKLFALYGPIEEYRLLDEEDCEDFTDVYWLKFSAISNARFAKRKLDEYQFLGHLLQVSYAPDYETRNDTLDKLEERKRTVMNRLRTIRKPEEKNQRQGQGPRDPLLGVFDQQSAERPQELIPVPVGNRGVYELRPFKAMAVQPHIDARHKVPHEHYGDPSMDATVQAVREKLDKISAVTASTVHLAGTKQTRDLETSLTTGVDRTQGFGSSAKKQRQDNRRRI